VNLDIEELKCAEQALRESEYKLRQIIDTVPSLLWSTGPDGEPTHVSQRLLDYSGMRLEDFQRGWEAFVHPADFSETAKAFYHAIQTGTSFQAVSRLRRADGELRWHQTRGEPLRDREGKSSSGTACQSTSMNARRPKNGCAAANPIWRRRRG
jgi:PAS domain S-box-containing protein